MVYSQTNGYFIFYSHMFTGQWGISDEWKHTNFLKRCKNKIWNNWFDIFLIDDTLSQDVRNHWIQRLGRHLSSAL